jgi:hypothetical protein
LNAIAIDGRGTKEKVIADLNRFATGSGRANAYPGKLSLDSLIGYQSNDTE